MTCIAVFAEAAKSSADAVSNTASDVLGGVSDGMSAAWDAAQQLLDSANSSTGDLQSAASDIQDSVSSSLSSAFDTLQTSTSSAVGASGNLCFAAQPALKGEVLPDACFAREQVDCQSLCSRCCQWSVTQPGPQRSKQQM